MKKVEVNPTLSSIFIAEKSTLRRPSYLISYDKQRVQRIWHPISTPFVAVSTNRMPAAILYSQLSRWYFLSYLIPIVPISIVFLAYFCFFVNCRVLKVPIVVKTGNLNWVSFDRLIDWWFRADPLSVNRSYFLFLLLGNLELKALFGLDLDFKWRDM